MSTKVSTLPSSRLRIVILRPRFLEIYFFNPGLSIEILRSVVVSSFASNDSLRLFTSGSAS